MADVPEITSDDPTEMLGIGRRHLAVRDYSAASDSLAKACELLGQKYGQTADECGDAYLWYGKSLLGLAREESGVLGNGIPQGAEENNDEEDVEDEAEGENPDEIEEDEAVPAAEDETVPVEAVPAAEIKSTEEKNGPSSSSGPGPSSSSAAGPSEEPDEGVDDEEDEVENLQLAWEVFELARDIFIKRGDRGKKELADAYLYLGEVSLESAAYDKAVVDMTKCLELLKELYSADDRKIAETYYQIGLAHSMSNNFDQAVEQFQLASEILQTRIKTLENNASEDPTVKKYLATDQFYTVEGEIKELKELLPEIQEKIQDMKEYKAEAIKSVRESLGLAPQNGSGNKAPAAAPIEVKKASDISHLVKRKRNPEDDKTEESPSKKPA